MGTAPRGGECAKALVCPISRMIVSSCGIFGSVFFGLSAPIPLHFTSTVASSFFCFSSFFVTRLSTLPPLVVPPLLGVPVGSPPWKPSLPRGLKSSLLLNCGQGLSAAQGSLCLPVCPQPAISTLRPFSPLCLASSYWYAGPLELPSSPPWVLLLSPLSFSLAPHCCLLFFSPIT